MSSQSYTFYGKIGQSYGIAIKPLQKDAKLPTKSILFFYSPNAAPKGYKILKHDPFLGFYLLESKTNLSPISLKEINNEMLEDETASITPANNVSGKISTRMQSPIDFATLNVPTFQNSLINTICEQSYGIGIGKNQFLEKSILIALSIIPFIMVILALECFKTHKIELKLISLIHFLITILLNTAILL